MSGSLRLEVANLFPHLSVRAVVIVLVGIITLDGDSEVQQSLLDANADICMPVRMQF